MVKAILAYFLIFVFLINVVSGQIDSDLFQNIGASGIQNSLDMLKNEYNSNTDQIPSFLKNNFGDARANLHINVYGADVLIGIQTEKSYMTEIRYGGLENQTVDLYTNLDTVIQVANGKLDVVEAFNNGKITYKAVGFTNKIKYGLLSFGLKLKGFFTKK